MTTNAESQRLPRDVTLRLPAPHEEAAVLRAHRATTPGHPTFLHGYRDGIDFTSYLLQLAERARPRAAQTAKDGDAESVPETFLFAFVEQAVVGRVSIRHALSPVDGERNGHIGYVVVPAFRRRGYATAMLRQALAIAHDTLGIARVLVTCDEDNLASIRTIERCGGVFDGTAPATITGKAKRRYWFA